MNQTNRSARNPNNKTVYIQDINLLAYNALSRKSGFVNWCLENKQLREEYEQSLTKVNIPT